MSSTDTKARFEAFEFDADPKWATYKANLEIPPGRNEAAILLKYKQKWYKQNIDPDFEVESVRATSSSSVPPSTGAYPRPTAPRPPSSTGPTSGSSPSSGRTSSPPSNAPLGRFDAGTLLFLANSWVVVMAVLHMLPLLPAFVSERAYRFCFLGAIVTYLYSIRSKYGLPRGFSLVAIRDWMQRLGKGSDFLYLMYSLLFISSAQPARLVVMPVGACALVQVCSHLQRNFSQTTLYRNYLEKGCSWVTRNTHMVQGFIAQTEITIGIMLVFFMLTPQRSVLQLLVMWHILKLKYHLPPSATYHRQLWTLIGQKVAPIRQMLPIVNVPLGYLQGWFNRLQ